MKKKNYFCGIKLKNKLKYENTQKFLIICLLWINGK